MNLSLLYKYGYDYGSKHVRPTSDDGNQDFFGITKFEPAPEFPDQRSVLHDSLLAGCMIVQGALNQSSFKWRAVAYDFLDHFMRHLGDGSMDYGFTRQNVMLFKPAELWRPEQLVGNRNQSGSELDHWLQERGLISHCTVGSRCLQALHTSTCGTGLPSGGKQGRDLSRLRLS